MIKIDDVSRMRGFSQWLREVHETVPHMSPTTYWVAGGAVRNLVEGRGCPENDIDIFATSEQYVDHAREMLVATGWKQCFGTEYAETYKHPDKSYKAQLIKINYRDIGSCLLDFDYTIAQCAYDGTSFYFGNWTLLDIGQKRLVANRFQNSLSSLRRMVKYVNYGYQPCQGTLEFLANEIRKTSPDEKAIWYID